MAKRQPVGRAGARPRGFALFESGCAEFGGYEA